MKYIVEIGYKQFGVIDDASTAISFAEIAHNYRMDKSDKVTIEIVEDDECNSLTSVSSQRT